MQERNFSRLIYEAIEGKYEGKNLEDVDRIVLITLASLRRIDSEQATLGQAVATSDFETDVVNQLRCLYSIEYFWRFEPPKRGFVQKVHAIASGIRQNDISLRTENYVPDFGGEVPWPVQDILRGLRLYEKFFAKVALFLDASREEKARFLGQIYADLIHIHPFTDANGRTARMLVQYCLRHWGDEYVLIPKVRNCTAWRSALDAGVRGDYEAIGIFFSSQIKTAHP